MKPTTHNDDETLCYCFGFTRKEIVDDLKQHGTSTLLTNITHAKRAGECRCMETHPERR
ncbi:hypothetical protein [Desulfoluna sp.]|uniref:hypothetical protein n=1 Tax=Desulfoluna sp. TaxID=2045199 RepID=UPI002615656C|nr:hypothetical protein [Desulfoluna sp.]